MQVGATMAFNHHTSAAFMVEAAHAVETAGFHSLWVPEHVVFFADYESRYPVLGNGRIPGDPEGVLDPFMALTYIAAGTRSIRLGAGICLVPQRQPVYTAKQVADLDTCQVGGWISASASAGSRKNSSCCRCPFRVGAGHVWSTWR